MNPQMEKRFNKRLCKLARKKSESFVFHLALATLQTGLSREGEMIFKYCIYFYSFFLFLALWKQLAQSHLHSYIFTTQVTTVPLHLDVQQSHWAFVKSGIVQFNGSLG